MLNLRSMYSSKLGPNIMELKDFFMRSFQFLFENILRLTDYERRRINLNIYERLNICYCVFFVFYKIYI